MKVSGNVLESLKKVVGNFKDVGKSKGNQKDNPFQQCPKSEKERVFRSNHFAIKTITNKTRTSKVGAISKAKKIKRLFFEKKNLNFLNFECHVKKKVRVCKSRSFFRKRKMRRLNSNNKTPAKHRDIFRPLRLRQMSHSYFGRGIGSKE